MFLNMSDNYKLRTFHLQNDQVPTETMVRKTMPPALAGIFFKALPPKLKELVVQKPKANHKGFGWFVPPKELLEGRAVKKPIKDELLGKLNHQAFVDSDNRWVIAHQKQLKKEKENTVLDADNNWKNTFEAVDNQQWEASVAECKKTNTEYIRQAFESFSNLYSASINNIEKTLVELASKEIQKVQDEVYLQKKSEYKTLLKSQQATLICRYEKLLEQKKENLEAKHILKVDMAHSKMINEIQNIRHEKNVTLAELSKLCECQNLACQIYIALKEREDCAKEIELSAHNHQKKVKKLTENIAFKDLQILLAEQKERKRKDIIPIWQKKLCYVVKQFQTFVTYCLNTLPEHAEFFINIEKLMLLQLNEALEEPTAENIFVAETQFNTPVPKPHPFYLVCNSGYKPEMDQALCPKHCTSSASQLPVIVINKRYMYAACDNFQQFSSKVKEYIHGKRGDDADFEDSLIYENYVPIKYTSSQQLLELKLESSLFQVLKQEMSNRSIDHYDCEVCKLPFCLCKSQDPKQPVIASSSGPAPSATLLDEKSIDRLKQEREPAWESYFEYVRPRKCSCLKTSLKHLPENLPAYMRHTNKYEGPTLPDYEMCSVATLKKLVKESKGRVSAPISKAPSETKKDMSTQYSDPEYDMLCTCFSKSELEERFKGVIAGSKTYDPLKADEQARVVTGSISPSYMTNKTSSFALDRAYSLRQLIDKSPELKGLFNRKKC